MSHTWEQRVQQLEAEGLTRSDAQSVADVEEQKGRLTMSHVKDTTLLDYVIAYLQVERDRLALTDQVWVANVKYMIEQALEAYAGGAR